MTEPTAWIAWLLPLTVLLPALTLATRGLQRVFRDPQDRPTLLVVSCVLGIALPLAHPAAWFLSEHREIAGTDLLGIVVLIALISLLFHACGVQALRGGRARWIAGALMGLTFVLADQAMIRILGIDPPPAWLLLPLAVAAMGLGALAFRALDDGRTVVAGAALFAALIAAVAASMRLGAGPDLALRFGALPLAGLSLGLFFAVLVGLLARRTAERRVAELRGDVMGWLTQMSDATPEASAVIADGEVATANAALLALLGQPAELVRGRALADLFPREGQAWWEAARQGRLSAWGRARLLTGDGLVTVEAAVRPLRGAAARCHVLICRDLTEQLETEARIQYLVRHDALTGLRNRADLLEVLGRQISQARHSGASFAVLQLGMDDFKVFNDLHGHGAGDLVLRDVARRITALLGPDVLAARTGGDEFTLILPIREELERPDRVAERLLAQIREPHLLGGEHLHTSACIGLAVFPRDADHESELLAMADLAMQRAKTEGIGRVALVDAERDAEARATRVLEQDLRLAVQNRQLRVWLQPQARGSDLAPVGFEALIRWQHPVHGLIPPSRFIPIAEATGLVHEIGAWVMREAMRQAASWPLPLRIAVNVSPLQLQTGTLPALIRDALRTSGLMPERLEIEITESMLIDQQASVLEQLQEVSALGVRISLDDFGAGYSSLSVLRSFPFDKLKMDRSFLSELETAPETETVVRAMLVLGRALNMSVVAEGVQTVRQLEFLRAEGCDFLQGYLLGMPAPAERFATIIERGHFDDDTLAEMAGRRPPSHDRSLRERGFGEEADEEDGLLPPLRPMAAPQPSPDPAPAPKARSRKAATPKVEAETKKAPAAKAGVKQGSPAKISTRTAAPAKKQAALALRVETSRLASDMPPAQRQEGHEQQGREGNALARPVGGRAGKKAQLAAAQAAEQGRAQQGDRQGPAEVLQIDGGQHRAELHVAPAHQPAAPRPPERQQADAGLEDQQGQRRLAPKGPAQKHQRRAGQDGGVGNVAAPKVPKGGDAAPGGQGQQPDQHAARISPSAASPSATGRRIGPKAAVPQQPGSTPGATRMKRGKK